MFKKGDKVRCIDCKEHPSLHRYSSGYKLNKVFTIHRVNKFKESNVLWGVESQYGIFEHEVELVSAPEMYKLY